VIDATTQGGIARLINHSCAPNCYSRVITLRWPQGQGPPEGSATTTCAATDELLSHHVVISALRDIPAGEEFTYDYQFAGKDALKCACGAATCRGVVNIEPPSPVAGAS
jgi:histone-lysine N-methyltransferase SETD1